MMGTKIRSFSPLPRDVSLEDLVPTDHFYRRLEADLDLSFVRELVRPLYAGGGRPSVDPVVFFKLQLVLFFEGIRSERRLMEIAADRLSVRWYLGYDLFEALPDHSSLTKIRERYGLGVFRGFFEKVVEMCAEAGLVWGKELFVDATKVDADASLDSIAPRFYVEEHLKDLFEEEPSGAENGDAGVSLRTADDEALPAENAAGGDWIARTGRQRREVKGAWYKRTADFLCSETDPDASPMKRRESKGSHLGYHAHYVVDGGKARVILNVLVTPFEVTENAPMLDLLWRSAFRWKLRPRQITGDTAYGTTENIAAIERAGIRAFMPLTGAGKTRPYFSKEEFAYDPERDLYRCPAGEILAPKTFRTARNQIIYKTEPGTCDSCSVRSRCTDNKTGRQVLRHRDERYVDRVKSYRGTFPYEKALRKRRVWVEPLFGEAKDWHGLRRFRLRRLEKVNAEALLVAAGQNVKRLLTFGRKGPRRPAQVVALRVTPTARRPLRRVPSRRQFPLARPFFNSLLSFNRGRSCERIEARLTALR
jgi:transposase